MTTPTREGIDATFRTMEARMEDGLASVEANMRAGFAEVRADMLKLSVDMHKSSTEIVKWIVGTAIAMLATAITVTTFVLNNAAPKPTLAQSAPIIVTVPTQPAPPVTRPDLRLPEK